MLTMTRLPTAFSRCLAALALLLALAPFALPARADIEVITLRYRSAEQIIPILQPLVEPGGAITGMQNQLVIRSSPANIADLRRVLATLDGMPRQLRISVRQGAEAESSERAGALSGTLSNRGSSVQGRITDSRDASDSRVTQTLQVLEGNVAVIQAGTSQPLPSRQVTRTPSGAIVVTDTTSYRDVGTGFAVLPRVSGERVTLEINPQRDTINANEGPRGTVNVQRASSIISGRLGEWIELGGMNQSETRSGSSILSGSSISRSDNRSIWVKVDEVR
jgi:type II secretory pathway component GspD/PulD (secretin)